MLRVWISSCWNGVQRRMLSVLFHPCFHFVTVLIVCDTTQIAATSLISQLIAQEWHPNLIVMLPVRVTLFTSAVVRRDFLYMSGLELL